MSNRNLPLNIWMVVESRRESTPTFVSTHQSQVEAESERDRRNEGLVTPRYSACIVLEPIAQRMGGQQSPTARP